MLLNVLELFSEVIIRFEWQMNDRCGILSVICTFVTSFQTVQMLNTSFSGFNAETPLMLLVNHSTFVSKYLAESIYCALLNTI